MADPEWLARARAEGRVTEGPRAAVPVPPAGTHLYAVVPVPPSVNNLFVTSGRRRVKSPGYRAWLAVAVPILAALRRPTRFPVRVTVTVFGHGRLNLGRDIANVEKPVGDALVLAGVLPDDSIRAGVWETVQRYRPGGPADAAAAVVSIDAIDGEG